MKKVDFLIIGSGIAGLSFALKAAKYGSVLIITKNNASDSNTNYAQGGIACVTGGDDNPELHIKDTLDAGAGLCNEEAVRTMVYEAPHCIKDLLEWGVSFSYNDAQFELGLEGGHSRHRILHMKDFTGREIESSLLRAVKNNPAIQILENHIATDLISDGESPNTCYGATVLNTENKTVESFLAGDTIICTGGAGQVYKHTTNPAVATGDGIAMACRAGAAISNMEFVQFHPTALYNPGGKVFLISEALRGAGAVLCNEYGEEFMHLYHPLQSLAPRDIVSRAIAKEMLLSGKDHVYLDATNISSNSLMNSFPQIYETCLVLGIDITGELIPVTPSAHFFCGGIVTDINGKTNIESLYAFGEAACTGVHGANRLASNSLLEAMVFSNRAFQDIISGLGNPVRYYKSNHLDFNHTKNELEADSTEANNLIEQVRSLTSACCGISRKTELLGLALSKILDIESKAHFIYTTYKKTQQTIELYNLALISRLIIQSALQRHESIGAHYVDNYKPATVEV
jgi:L-aspartate oxidase